MNLGRHSRKIHLLTDYYYNKTMEHNPVSVSSVIFKAYDIRGVYPIEVDEKVFAVIAKALSHHFGSGKVIVGHDARLSSPKLYRAVIRAAKRKGTTVIPVGLLTTPMLYFLVNNMNAS